MNAVELIKPCPDWSHPNWLTRVDAAASLLFVHGFIPQSQREKITLKLEREIARGCDAGEIVKVSGASQ